jgi:hypothetical protein
LAEERTTALTTFPSKNVGGTLAALVAGRNDPGFVHNGPLAGLVAVCAGSDVMHPAGSFVVGAVAGGLFVYMFTLTQNRWKIDDVLGVWPLHGLCGAWGGIACGIFGSKALGGIGGVTFMSQLAGQELDLVLADRPIGPGLRAHAFNHLLGECGTTFLATPKLASSLKRNFPRSLEGAPCLLPGAHATIRRTLDQWFEREKLHPTLVAEFDNSALMYAFGEEGQGFFPAPTVFESEFRRRYHVQAVGRVKTIQQQFYAISVDQRLHHPAVAAIVKAARQNVFA